MVSSTATPEPSLAFLGATGTVTGSRYLLRIQGRMLLVDCGLFQGYQQLRRKNWMMPPFDPAELACVLLTHAHIDHSGYLPLLVKHGFRGPVWATRATIALCRVLLPDSGFLQEEQAGVVNGSGCSKHSPALPLYTRADAMRSLELLRPIDRSVPFEPLPGVSVRFERAGHLLGASSVHVQTTSASILFSGDVGRPDDLLMKAPAPPLAADCLVLESTYGDRVHQAVDLQAQLGQVISRGCGRAGTIVIPTFALGRAQLLLLLIARLKAADEIPDVPVYLDSPMAIDATALHRKFAGEHRLATAECAAMFRGVQLVRTADESRALDQDATPKVILAASSMATGGRVVHHIAALAPDRRNLIALAGFQAAGTRGALLAGGAQTLRIHGQDVPINAEVVQLPGMSAHADANELLAWIRQLSRPPRVTYITHGESGASDALRQRIERELRWRVVVPEFRDLVSLLPHD
jgi:metallo-beta-lactamase family protein